MKKTMSRRIELMFLVCAVTFCFALFSPTVCHGDELDVEFSPNIINILSERFGDIRVWTGMRYSNFVANGDSLFIYFNECDSVENIKATRDSLGNLILRFSLEDLLSVEGCLERDTYNDALVIITMTNGVEYTGYGKVYISDKQQGAEE